MAKFDLDHIDGVDFYGAIQAHVLWRKRLEAYIDRHGDESLDADIVGHDNHCPLGEWINGDGGKHFGTHPNFSELKEAHACFHREAGEIIRCADRGESEEAHQRLKRDYAACSHKVKANLAKLGLIHGKG